MADEEDKIKIMKKESKKKSLRNFTIFVVVMLILSVLTPFIILILGIILMLAGVSAMYDLGTVIESLWKNLPREKKSLEEKALFDRSFYEGIILSGGGFFLFLLALYILSMGWRGLLGI